MKKNILIVEDQEELALALSEALESKGFVVRTAATAEDGVEMIHSEVPEVLLLDLTLPGMSGMELLKSLRNGEATKGLPVMILSNMDNPEDFKEAHQYDVVEYLVKSDWRLDDIINKIKHIS